MRLVLPIAGLLFCCVLLALLFDVKITDGGDDCSYVQSAFYFLKNGSLPGYQGPLYPVVLSPVIRIWGLNIVLLKLTSAVFLLAFLAIFYRLYQNAAWTAGLLLVFFFCIVNSHLLFFGYQLYSEAFFLLVLVLTIFYFDRHFIAARPGGSVMQIWGAQAILSLLLLACFLTRTAGIFCVMAVFLYFLLYGQWRHLYRFILILIVVFAAWLLLKKMIWPAAEGLHFKTQLTDLLQKDYYTPSKGREDLPGMLQRFWDNSKQYLSFRFLDILGLVSDPEFHGNVLLTLLFYGVSGLLLWYYYRRNRLLFFTCLVILSGCVVSFLALQVNWNQERIVVIYVPFILITLTVALEKWRIGEIYAGKIVASLFVGLVCVIDLKNTFEKIAEHQPERIENASGDLLYGYMPDMRNYLEAAQWCGRNISHDSAIACRKPSIAFVFSQTPTFGIYAVPVIPEQALTDSCRTDFLVPILVDDPVTLKKNQDFAFNSLFNRFLYAVVVSENNSRRRTGLVYRIPAQLKDSFLAMARTYSLPPFAGLSAISGYLRSGGYSWSIYQVDEMKDILQRNHVSHIILASLRLNPSENTGDYLNTVHRYVLYVGLKYPEMFTPVMKIGATEPATIFHINYPGRPGPGK